MVLATARHPAMLIYLDNVQSIGPNSIAGQRRGKGLNENYARELMELHTLGVDGGYTQADVISLAKILTGWSFDRSGGEVRLAYAFQPRMHEPGNKSLLGYTFREAGEQEGIIAIDMLAKHPSTARHIATKLARHFIADDPPASAVETIAATFQGSEGYMPMVMEAVIKCKEAWQPYTKVKNPYEYAVSAFRLMGTEPPDAKHVVGNLEALNFRAFNASSPAGYADTASAWVSPDAVTKRIEWAHRFAQRFPGNADPLQLAEAGIPAISDTTAETIKRAASGKDGLAFLLASPEFMRR
jgi:uncharacterized protein (DUF1800 family)